MCVWLFYDLWPLSVCPSCPLSLLFLCPVADDMMLTFEFIYPSWAISPASLRQSTHLVCMHESGKCAMGKTIKFVVERVGFVWPIRLSSVRWSEGTIPCGWIFRRKEVKRKYKVCERMTRPRWLWSIVLSSYWCSTLVAILNLSSTLVYLSSRLSYIFVRNCLVCESIYLCPYPLTRLSFGRVGVNRLN